MKTYVVVLITLCFSIIACHNDSKKARQYEMLNIENDLLYLENNLEHFKNRIHRLIDSRKDYQAISPRLNKKLIDLEDLLELYFSCRKKVKANTNYNLDSLHDEVISFEKTNNVNFWHSKGQIEDDELFRSYLNNLSYLPDSLATKYAVLKYFNSLLENQFYAYYGCGREIETDLLCLKNNDELLLVIGAFNVRPNSLLVIDSIIQDNRKIDIGGINEHNGNYRVLDYDSNKDYNIYATYTDTFPETIIRYQFNKFVKSTKAIE